MKDTDLLDALAGALRAMLSSGPMPQLGTDVTGTGLIYSQGDAEARAVLALYEEARKARAAPPEPAPPADPWRRCRALVKAWRNLPWRAGAAIELEKAIIRDEAASRNAAKKG